MLTAVKSASILVELNGCTQARKLQADHTTRTSMQMLPAALQKSPELCSYPANAARGLNESQTLSDSTILHSFFRQFSISFLF